MRVLIVDDSDAVRGRVREMIAEALPRASIGEASTGRDALAAIAGDATADVVILDLHLAGEDGLAVLEAIRAVSSAVAVIVLTNDASEHHRRECATRGATHFFDKSREFEQAVEAVVARARPASSGA
jgi:DNA-binding NarL/FixJ family response regulator